MKFKYYINKLKSIIKVSTHDTNTKGGRSNERYRRIFMTGGGALTAKIISVSTSLITIPLTLHYLGPERYGLWMTISSVIILMKFADFGLGNGLINAISSAHGKDSEEEAKIAVSNTFFMLLAIALLGGILLFTIYPYIPWGNVYNVNTDVAINEAGPTMLVLTIFFLINLPLGITQRIHDGYQEGYKFQFWLSIGAILSLINVLISIYLKVGLPTLLIAYLSGPLISTLINGFILFFKSRRYLQPRWRYFELHVGKQLLKTGIIFFFLQLFTLIITASDNIIIARFLGPTFVASYAIVNKLFMFTMLTQFLIAPLWPAFGEAMTRGDIDWARRTLIKGLKLSIGFGLVLALPLLVFGRPIIGLWVGSDFIPSWSLLFGFYFFAILGNYNGMMSTFLNSGPLVGKQTVMIGLAAVTAILLKIYLLQTIGLSGVVWATSIGYGVFYVIPSARLAYKHLK